MTAEAPAGELEVVDGPRLVFVRKLAPTTWPSVHEQDDLEPSETLCGLSLEVDVDAAGFVTSEWERWSTIPLALKSCESCLRFRASRDAKAKAAAQ